jgi:cytochrome c oxidase assembly factor CtaG
MPADEVALWDMVQHLLVTLVMPRLLLIGLPSWLLRRLLAPKAVMASRLLKQPADRK